MNNAKTTPKSAPARHAASRHSRALRVRPVCGFIATLLFVCPSLIAHAQQEGGGYTGAVSSVPPALPGTTGPTGSATPPLPAMPSTAHAAASVPATLPATLRCVGEMETQPAVSIAVGKSTVMNLPDAIRSRSVGNPAVIQTVLVSPKSLYMLASHIGTTNMILQARSGACSVIDVVVNADASGLQDAIRAVVPEEKDVHVKAAGNALVLMGTVSDAVAAQRIVEIAHQFVGSAALAPPDAPKPGGGLPFPADPIVNMLQVASPQQVMLEVKVAEVSKTLVDKLGANWAISANVAHNLLRLVSQLGSGSASLVGYGGSYIDLEKSDQLTKVLAEPTLTAISGQSASFLAGGKVYLPIPQSLGVGGGAAVVTLQEQEFGIRLNFTPTVLKGGRINLQVMSEVSELSSTGATVQAAAANVAILPVITTRQTSTTIQLYDGQSFAIGGALKNNVSGTLKAIPGVGELPVIGALMRDTNFQADKTELVFIVTPHLAKPLPPNYPLPTDTFGDVGSAEVLLTGNMEHRQQATPAAPAGGASAPAPDAPTPGPGAPEVPVATPVPSVRPLTQESAAATQNNGATPAPSTPEPNAARPDPRSAASMSPTSNANQRTSP